MQTPSRRQYLALASATATLSLAGCVSDDDEPEFLVTNTNFRIEEDSGDMVVQVTIENGTVERQESDLEVTVRHSSREEEWRKESSVSLAGATELQREFRFEGIHRDGDDVNEYEIDARLLDGIIASE